MITVGIASIPARVDSLKNTLLSIHKQVNIVHVSLNGYTEIPKWAEEFSNVFFYLSDNVLGDAYKFHEVANSCGYYLSLDDDIIYPPDYAEHMIEKCDEYSCPVSLHGKRFDNYPIHDYHRGFTKNFHCRSTVIGDHKVDVVGTGVLCFHTKQLKISIDDFKVKNMADLWFSLKAKQQGVLLMVVEHIAGWIGYQEQSWTIWKDNKRTGKETEIINEIMKP